MTIGTSVLAIAGMLFFAVAGIFERSVATAAEVVPADEILMIVSEMGLEPSSRVQQRGSYYVVHAVDPRGAEVRVVADMRSGTILSVVPLHGSPVQAPRHDGGARIIHVPQADDGTESTVVYGRSDTVVPRGQRKTRAAPPPQLTSAPPPPPARPRTMLNVPRQKERALSPVYPTPRFDSGAAGEKFELHNGATAGDAPSPAAD